MFKQLFIGSVYRRILGSFMLITALIAVVSFINFVQLGRVRETTSQALPASETLPLIQEYTVALSTLDADIERFLVVGGAENFDTLLFDMEHLSELEADIHGLAPDDILPEVEELDRLTNELAQQLASLNQSDISSKERNQQTVSIFNSIESISFGLQTLLQAVTNQLESTIISQENTLASVLSQQIILTVIVVAGALIGSVVLARGIVNPLTEIAETTAQIAQGQYSTRLNIQSSDEIGQLATSFNDMAAQLEELIGSLEQRVSDRTRDLEIAATVSHQVSRVLDMKQLLPYLVNTTRDGFNLSHVSIFLYEEDTNILRLAAGSGSVGRKMLVEGKQFHLDDVGLVPLTGRTSEHQIINDVQASHDHFVNPLLPNTRSEVTLPMRVGTRLIGVLDIQADEVGRFNDEQIAVLSSLADQIAIAVQNAGLFTNLQAARADAEQASVVKSQFLASMSHELRTPLNAVLNFTQFVSSGMLGKVNAEQVEMLDKVVASGQHLLSLINDVLDISKIESGALKLFVETNVDMAKEVESVLATAEGMLAEKPVELLSDIELDLPFVIGDKRRIRQIMLNLVSNACKFTDEGEVRISLKQESDFVRFIVADTGFGIAEEDHDTIFETFRQSDGGLRQGEGTGLGLPISLRLAETHGGTLNFVSTLNVGSTFSFTIPINNPQLAALVSKKEKTNVA